MGARNFTQNLRGDIRAAAKASFGVGLGLCIELRKGNAARDQQQIKLRSEPNKS
jgi:hypothetical protein